MERFIAGFLKRFARAGATRRVALAILLLIAGFSWVGCSEPEDYANPYDPENLRTAGAPPNVIVKPGDATVQISWTAIGVKGIKEYRIYRATEPDIPDSGDIEATLEYTLVATRPAVVDENLRERPGHVYIVRDDDNGKGLENDRTDFQGRPIYYRYRLTFVDVNSVETPDPKSPPKSGETPLRLWTSHRAAPSQAPPPPVVETAVDDLLVVLNWETYLPPGDAVAYRVYGRLITDEQNPTLTLLREIPIQSVQIPDLQGEVSQLNLYADRDFHRDKLTKEYLVAVVDKFGVESPDRPEVRRRATSPNLPPKPVTGFQIVGVTGGGGIRFRWNRNTENDLAGYNLYSQGLDGSWRLRKTIRDPAATSLTFVENLLQVQYFLTAFDNTPREDGNFDQIYPPE